MKTPFSVEGQGSIRNLIQGDHSINMTSQGDIHQITSYMLSPKSPGVLVYPQQGGTLKGESTVQDELKLKSIELKTDADCDSYSDYSQELTEQAKDVLCSLVYEMVE